MEPWGAFFRRAVRAVFSTRVNCSTRAPCGTASVRSKRSFKQAANTSRVIFRLLRSANCSRVAARSQGLKKPSGPWAGSRSRHRRRSPKLLASTTFSSSVVRCGALQAPRGAAQSVRSMQAADQLVYVNQDGSVRELSHDECRYLAQQFHPSDGGCPYIKESYDCQDGWGGISGFLRRTSLPSGIVVEPVNPHYVPQEFDARRQDIEDSKRVGDIVTENPDGSVTCSPNPDIPHEKRFELLREIALERQRQREKLAKHPDYE